MAALRTASLQSPDPERARVVETNEMRQAVKISCFVIPAVEVQEQTKTDLVGFAQLNGGRLPDPSIEQRCTRRPGSTFYERKAAAGRNKALTWKRFYPSGRQRKRKCVLAPNAARRRSQDAVLRAGHNRAVNANSSDSSTASHRGSGAGKSCSFTTDAKTHTQMSGSEMTVCATRRPRQNRKSARMYSPLSTLGSQMRSFSHISSYGI